MKKWMIGFREDNIVDPVIINLEHAITIEIVYENDSPDKENCFIETTLEPYEEVFRISFHREFDEAEDELYRLLEYLNGDMKCANPC